MKRMKTTSIWTFTVKNKKEIKIEVEEEKGEEEQKEEKKTD